MPKENLLKADYFFNRYYFRPVASLLVPYLAKTHLTPTLVTFLAFLTGLVSVGGFWTSNYLLGSIFIHIQIILDVCDGTLARYKGVVSEFGAKLDATLDIIFWFLIFLALALSANIEFYLLVGVWATFITHLAITRYAFPNIAENLPRKRRFNKWFHERRLRFGFDEVLILIIVSLLAPLRLIDHIFWITIIGRNVDWIYRLIETEG